MIFRIRTKIERRRFFTNLDTLLEVFTEETAVLDMLKTYHTGQKDIINNIYERTQYARSIAHDLNNGNTRGTINEEISDLGKELSKSATYITHLVAETKRIKAKTLDDWHERQKYSE